jgi:hypothetical protein
MLETARACEPFQSQVEYLHCDATHPRPQGDPSLDGNFDLVASMYVLCYATTMEELIGFFTTARRAIAGTGGRLVAMTLNPGYGRGHDYYAGYGFTLTQEQEGEGAPVTLEAALPGGQQLKVTAHWWSRQAYERAAASAGFTTITWTQPTVSDHGMAAYGSDYWAAYLAAPQGVILQASVPEPDNASNHRAGAPSS